MKYIAHKRFKGTALCGPVNIPALSECERDGEIISWNDQPICCYASENGLGHFCRDDDGHGAERGRLAMAIRKRLEKRDKKYQDRWDLVWDDPVCQPLRRQDYEDYWLWGPDFYEADIETLQHIADLVGVKKKEEKANDVQACQN